MNSYSSMHIAHQSDVLCLPFSFCCTTCTTMATTLLAKYRIPFFFSFSPKNSPNIFCRLGRFFSSLFPLPLYFCEFEMADIMEAAVGPPLLLSSLGYSFGNSCVSKNKKKGVGKHLSINCMGITIRITLLLSH